MRKPEARFWQSVKNNLALPADRFDRIENAFGEGIPDVNATMSGEDVWIELKAPRTPARETTKLMTANSNHPLLDSQINWFIRHRQAGGIAFILVRATKHLMLIDGTKHAEVVNSWTLDGMICASIFTCSVPIKRSDWRVLHHVIFTAARHHRLHRSAESQRLLDDMVQGARKLARDRKPRSCDGA